MADLASQRPTEAHRLTRLDRNQLGIRHPAPEAAPRGALQIAAVPDAKAQQPEVRHGIDHQAPPRATGDGSDGQQHSQREHRRDAVDQKADRPETEASQRPGYSSRSDYRWRGGRPGG